MKVTVEGIVLNETNYKETSKILNILTKEYGYISVLSKGSRTLKNKLRGISMKFVYANFTILYKEKGMSTLIEGSYIDSFKNILKDFNRIYYANYLINLFKSVLKESQELDLFKILRDSLLKINEGFAPDVILIIASVKLLKYLGVTPNFLECVHCGKKEIYTFDMNLAGCICENCYQEGYLFSKNTIKLLRLFLNVDIQKIDKLNISSKKVLDELKMFVKEYYDEYTGIYLKEHKV